MGRLRQGLDRVRRWPSTSLRILAIRLMLKTSKPLTAVLALDLLAMALLPTLVIVAMGDMVGRIPAAIADGMDSPAGDRLVLSFVYVGVAFVLSMVTGPLHTALGSVIKVRLTYAMQSRLMNAVSGPTGIAHLEDPAVLDGLAMAQGTLMNFWPADAPATLVVVLSNRMTWIAGCAIVGTFRWWLGLALLLFWGAVRQPVLRVIREHVAAFGGNADVMRRAFYFEELATRPAAASETRVFGLGNWVIDRYRTHWLKGMEEVWNLRAGMNALLLKVTAAVFVVYVGSCTVIALAAIDGEIGLRTVAILLPILAVTMIAGSISFDDISIEWMLSGLPYLVDAERELSRRHDRLEGAGESRGLPKERITFEGIRFAYPGSRHDVFTDLDLEIRAGRSTAIVGPNGAGKTTLVKLLARLHPPTAGRITVDGIDVASLRPGDWQRRVGVVFQDFTRYPVSASDNIGFGAIEHLDDREQIAAAAHRAGARTLIEALPRSWDTVLSRQFTGGADLSGGQWQRVALARALYAAQRGAPILVLDEPTAWMDVRGEAEFFERFLDITRGLTTLIISHRFSTVRLADEIFVLENGRVAERGSHAELLALGGLYARMFTVQATRFVDDAELVGEP